MCKISSMHHCFVASLAKGSKFRHCSLLAMAICWSWSCSLLAGPYSFLTVSGNNVPGNLASSTFTSSSNGFISVTHNSTTPNSFGNWGTLDNINSAINPSQFSTLFPGTGNVQGHLAMSMYGDPMSPFQTNTTTVTFDLTTYTGNMSSLIFGLWNTTVEVGQPVYNIQLKDSLNLIGPPSGVTIFGNDDNTGAAGVPGKYQMQLTPATGDITFSTIINNAGTHTDALFISGIPLGTKEIIVTANLPPLNNIGDGVGYYFVEAVPEPSSIALIAIGILLLGTLHYRRMRSLQL